MRKLSFMSGGSIFQINVRLGCKVHASLRTREQASVSYG